MRALLAQGHSVRAMLAPGENPINLRGLEVEHMTADLTDAKEIRQAVKGCDTVYHLAAIYALWLKNPNKFYEVNVGGTNNLMQACLEEGVGKVVHTSSIAAVGVTGDGTPATEETPFSDYHVNDHYVLSKHRSEQEALSWARRGLPVVVVNPGFPFWCPRYQTHPNGAYDSRLT